MSAASTSPSGTVSAGGVAMMAYVGQARSLALIAELENHGIGESRVRRAAGAPIEFFHDPAAYLDWRAGQPAGTAMAALPARRDAVAMARPNDGGRTVCGSAGLPLRDASIF